jgi:hypothetical protein
MLALTLFLVLGSTNGERGGKEVCRLVSGRGGQKSRGCRGNRRLEMRFRGMSLIEMLLSCAPLNGLRPGHCVLAWSFDADGNCLVV